MNLTLRRNAFRRNNRAFKFSSPPLFWRDRSKKEREKGLLISSVAPCGEWTGSIPGKKEDTKWRWQVQIGSFFPHTATQNICAGGGGEWEIFCGKPRYGLHFRLFPFHFRCCAFVVFGRVFAGALSAANFPSERERAGDTFFPSMALNSPQKKTKLEAACLTKLATLSNPLLPFPPGAPLYPHPLLKSCIPASLSSSSASSPFRHLGSSRLCREDKPSRKVQLPWKKGLKNSASFFSYVRYDLAGYSGTYFRTGIKRNTASLIILKNISKCSAVDIGKTAKIIFFCPFELLGFFLPFRVHLKTYELSLLNSIWFFLVLQKSTNHQFQFQ